MDEQQKLSRDPWPRIVYQHAKMRLHLHIWHHGCLHGARDILGVMAAAARCANG